MQPFGKKLCTAFVLLFDKKHGYFTPHFYCLPLICTGSASNTELQRLPNVCCNLVLFPLRLRMHCIFYLASDFCTAKWSCGAFCRLGFEHTKLSPGVRLLHRKMILKDDGTLSGIVAHLQERRHTFKDYGMLARKDAVLSR